MPRNGASRRWWRFAPLILRYLQLDVLIMDPENFGWSKMQRVIWLLVPVLLPYSIFIRHDEFVVRMLFTNGLFYSFLGFELLYQLLPLFKIREFDFSSRADRKKGSTDRMQSALQPLKLGLWWREKRTGSQQDGTNHTIHDQWKETTRTTPLINVSNWIYDPTKRKLDAESCIQQALFYPIPQIQDTPCISHSTSTHIYELPFPIPTTFRD